MSSGANIARDAPVSGPKRRNRVAVSCFGCRQLKTKCDGGKPVCSTCAHSGRNCVYSQRGISGNMTNTVMVNQEYLRALEQRLEVLERNSTLDSTTKTLLPQSRKAGEQRHPPRSREQCGSSISGHASSPASHGGTPSSVVADADVSMGGVSFTQLILNALHGHENVKAQSMTTDNDVREKQSHLTEEDLYSLPFNAVELVDQFFAFRHTLSPVFHVPSVRPLFDAALRCPLRQRSSHRSSLVLLNMIFAICTSHWLIGPEDNPQAARRHYDIAMALMQPNLLRDWRLEHVQALLIGARYLQGSNCADECWNVLGLAIRIAYGLRLHRDPPETDPHPLRESKRRVWYAAYTLDVLLSMIYDRPPAIRSTEYSVRLPEDLDDTYIRSGGTVYPVPRQPSSMSFSIEVVKLYQILENLMSRLSSNVENGRKIAELVMPLDEDYRRWHRALPSHLVLDYAAPEEQPWILALRGNMVRIMIHRQSLMMTLHGLWRPQEVEDSIVSHALQYSRNICVSAAMETVDIVSLRHEQTKKTMGLNWFNIYYLFNAVIVLVSHVVDPAYSNDKAALGKVDLALHMIKAMSNNHAFAQRAYSFLQQVLGYMHRSMVVRPDRDDHAPLSRDLLLPQPAGALPAALPNGADTVPDLHALFGFTQDLTDNLETYLENFETGGFADGSWPSNDPAIQMVGYSNGL